MKHVLPLLAVAGLTGCAQIQSVFSPAQTPAAAAATTTAEPVETLDPTPPPPPPETARTAEEFDTTTDEDRAEAAAPPEGGDTALGTVVASLGDPADPGFWLKTGLVDTLTPGRVETAAGESANVELRPGGEGSSAQISLAAMRLLGLSLTDLPELTVYAD